MSTKKIVLFAALILVSAFSGLILTSCAAAGLLGTREAIVDYVAEDRYYAAEEYAMEPAPPDAPQRINGKVGEAALRHVIRTGSIDLTVENTREKVQEIREIAKEAEGIVSNSYIYEIREGQFGAQMTLRIPEKRFDAVMEQLEALGKAANVRSGVDDVTMQYIDLESRLNNQKAQEARLVEILEMAETVEEVLEVERELYRVRGEIESMTAQFTHLQDQVAYSTINVTLREETIPTGTISPGPFHEIGSRIAQAFIGSINFILSAVSFMIIALSALIPVLILLGIVIVLIVLLARKFKKRKTAAGEEVTK